MALTKRKETILQIIVDAYISTAIPIASKAVAYNSVLQVSPATVRNDIADLAEEEYIIRSHLSAGAIPTDKAYRYYVESIEIKDKLSLNEQHQLQKLFQKKESETEQWVQSIAIFLAHLVHNVAIITSPKVLPCRFKHLDLVAIENFVALLVLVLHEAKVGKKILSFQQKITQDELTTISNKFNAIYKDMTSSEITEAVIDSSPNEKEITSYIIDMITYEDKHECNKPYLEGLHLMFSQPEFTVSEKILNLLELLEEKDWWENILSHGILSGGTKVIIGRENEDEAWRDLSLIISEYGVDKKAKGIIGVIGPKRIDYRKVINSVNVLSSLLSRSIVDYI
jgi:heat-inducible transcriptional repressor